METIISSKEQGALHISQRGQLVLYFILFPLFFWGFYIALAAETALHSLHGPSFGQWPTS
jgi:hypothetical protein